jgi:hypothetical protein
MLGSKTLHTDPQLRQSLQILLIATSDRELPSSPHAEHIVARGAWMNLLNQRRVHQHRSMNTHKPMQIELFGNGRDRLAQYVLATRPSPLLPTLELRFQFRYAPPQQPLMLD